MQEVGREGHGKVVDDIKGYGLVRGGIFWKVFHAIIFFISLWIYILWGFWCLLNGVYSGKNLWDYYGHEQALREVSVKIIKKLG